MILFVGAPETLVEQALDDLAKTRTVRFRHPLGYRGKYP